MGSHEFGWKAETTGAARFCALGANEEGKRECGAVAWFKGGRGVSRMLRSCSEESWRRLGQRGGACSSGRRRVPREMTGRRSALKRRATEARRRAVSFQARARAAKVGRHSSGMCSRRARGEKGSPVLVVHVAQQL